MIDEECMCRDCPNGALSFLLKCNSYLRALQQDPLCFYIILYLILQLPSLECLTFQTQHKYLCIVKQGQGLEYDNYLFCLRQNTIEIQFVGMDLILIRNKVICCTNKFIIKQIFLGNDTIFFGVLIKVCLLTLRIAPLTSIRKG